MLQNLTLDEQKHVQDLYNEITTGPCSWYLLPNAKRILLERHFKSNYDRNKYFDNFLEGVSALFLHKAPSYNTVKNVRNSFIELFNIT